MWFLQLVAILLLTFGIMGIVAFVTLHNEADRTSDWTLKEKRRKESWGVLGAGIVMLLAGLGLGALFGWYS
jgi:hypothetical protein